MTPGDLAIVLGYFALVLALGLWVGGRVRTFRDYFVVSGRLTTPLLVCTLVSTYYGLDVLFGVSEVSYQEGVVGFYAYSRPYYLFILVAALVVARRLKRFDYLSLPDVTASAFGNGARIACAVASLLYSLPILAVMGLGILLDVLFGIPLVWGVMIAAATSLAYTALGGLIADSITDTVQFVLMCVTVGIATWLGLGHVGGIDALFAKLPDSFRSPGGGYSPALLAVFALSGLSALVEPAFYQRIFAAVSYRSVAFALLIGIVLWASFDWAVTVLGMVARTAGVSVSEPRYALLEVTLSLLPAGLTGLFIAGVAATAMSTIDTYLLIAGGNLAYDIWRPLRRREPTDAELLRATRLAMGGATVLTVLIALAFQSIVSAWIFMATLLVGTALVPVLAALYLPFPQPKAAGTAAAVTGLVASAGYYTALRVFGAYDLDAGTVMLDGSVAGISFELWQEHALLFALPASILAYLVGALASSARHRWVRE